MKVRRRSQSSSSPRFGSGALPSRTACSFFAAVVVRSVLGPEGVSAPAPTRRPRRTSTGSGGTCLSSFFSPIFSPPECVLGFHGAAQALAVCAKPPAVLLSDGQQNCASPDPAPNHFTALRRTWYVLVTATLPHRLDFLVLLPDSQSNTPFAV